MRWHSSFSDYLSSLEYGAIGIMEDNEVCMEVVRDSEFITSLQGITKCDGVEYTAFGTPCIKYKFYQGEDKIIESFIYEEYNTMAHKTVKHYKGNMLNASLKRSFRQVKREEV